MSPHEKVHHDMLVEACEILAIPYEGKTPNEMLSGILAKLRTFMEDYRAMEARVQRLREILG